jgi:stage II sporulation protein D
MVLIGSFMKHILSFLLAMLICVMSISATYAYNIRVGLLTRVQSSTIATQTESVLMDARHHKPLVKLNQRIRYTAFAKNGTIFLKKANNEIYSTNYTSVFVIPVDKNSLVYCNNKWYRGSLKLQARGEHLTVINIVDLEDYVKGVVPAEMPASWNVEALKAQAITARSYALANLNKHRHEGYDLNTTTTDQVYKGASVENARSNYAVMQTIGQVIVQNNKVVPAYYHSSSGGITDDEAWSGVINFVKVVRDFDQQSPNSSWTRQYTISQFSNSLASRGYNIGQIQGLVPLDKSRSGRIKKLKLVGSSGSKNIDGEQFRKMFNLPSCLFAPYVSADTLLIQGKGSGHGVGMSQWGAKALADRGCSVYQILGYYFANVEIKTLSQASS